MESDCRFLGAPMSTRSFHFGVTMEFAISSSVVIVYVKATAGAQTAAWAG